MPCSQCIRNTPTTIVIDSALYYGVATLRDYVVKSNSPLFFDKMEKMVRTATFAGASLVFDGYLPKQIQDAFMYAGEQISSAQMCAYCAARNLYLCVIQFLVHAFRMGKINWSNEMWLGLDEFVRLFVVDMSSAWIRPALLKNAMFAGSLAPRMPGEVRSVRVPEISERTSSRY